MHSMNLMIAGQLRYDRVESRRNSEAILEKNFNKKRKADLLELYKYLQQIKHYLRSDSCSCMSKAFVSLLSMCKKVVYKFIRIIKGG